MSFSARIAIMVVLILTVKESRPSRAGLDHALGSEGAPVTIIEYASLSCPFCAVFHNELLPWLKKEYIATGKVRFVYRDYPLNGPALWGAAFAHCLPDDQYFAALALLFKKQAQWAFVPDPKAALAELAAQLGLSEVEFADCLNDKRRINEILEQVLLSRQKYEIYSTPSFLINDEIYANQKLGRNDFERLIDKLSSAGSK